MNRCETYYYPNDFRQNPNTVTQTLLTTDTIQTAHRISVASHLRIH